MSFAFRHGIHSFLPRLFLDVEWATLAREGGPSYIMAGSIPQRIVVLFLQATFLVLLPASTGAGVISADVLNGLAGAGGPGKAKASSSRRSHAQLLRRWLGRRFFLVFVVGMVIL